MIDEGAVVNSALITNIILLGVKNTPLPLKVVVETTDA